MTSNNEGHDKQAGIGEMYADSWLNQGITVRDEVMGR